MGGYPPCVIWASSYKSGNFFFLKKILFYFICKWLRLVYVETPRLYIYIYIYHHYCVQQACPGLLFLSFVCLHDKTNTHRLNAI